MCSLTVAIFAMGIAPLHEVYFAVPGVSELYTFSLTEQGRPESVMDFHALVNGMAQALAYDPSQKAILIFTSNYLRPKPAEVGVFRVIDKHFGVQFFDGILGFEKGAASSPRGSFLLVTGELADTPGLQSMLVNNDISQVVRHQLWRGPATFDLNGNVVWRIEEGFEKLNPVTGVTELIPTCGNGLGLVVQIQPLNEDKMLIVASESQERFAVKLLFDSGSRIVYRGNGLAVLDPSEHGLFSIVDIEGDRLKTFDLDGTLTDNVAFCVKDAVPDDWDWKAVRSEADQSLADFHQSKLSVYRIDTKVIVCWELGYRFPSFVSMYNLENNMWIFKVKLGGAKGGGLTNLVFH